MAFGRPRSIARLVLYGFAVVTIPLLAAVITAVVQVDRLAERGRLAVVDAEITTQESRALVQNLTEMERSMGQYRVLHDRDFYATYLARRGAFRAAAERLAALKFGTQRGQQLRDLMAAEDRLNRRLLTPGGDPIVQADAAAVSGEWAALGESTRAMLGESSTLIDLEANNARDAAQALQRTLLLQTTAVIPVTLLSALVFFLLITRPLREISSEIRRLGSGEFAAPVSIKGPHDLEEVGSRLDWLRRRILELEEQKAMFLRHISHELKTPLTSIREGVELLVDDNDHSLGPEQKEIAQIMRESSQHLQRLIENLLQFGRKLAPNAAVIPKQTVRIDDVVRIALEKHSLGRTAKNLRLTANLEPVSLAGDAEQLRTVIDNLLSNAIKYTPATGQLDVSLSQRDGAAILEVSDSGPGVDRDEREQVFEPFYQGRAPYDGYVQGSGLGLAIARQYVEAHDGRIEIVDSRFGNGACVRVRFPRVQNV